MIHKTYSYTSDEYKQRQRDILETNSKIDKLRHENDAALRKRQKATKQKIESQMAQDVYILL